MDTELQIVELINGEKLIAEVVYRENVVELTSPFVVAMQPTQTGQMAINLIPWPIFKNETDKTFIIDVNHVLIRYVPNNQFIDHFRRSTAKQSGLILPPGITKTRLIQE